MCLQAELNKKAKFDVGNSVILIGNTDALEPYIITAKKKDQKDQWVYQINHIGSWIEEKKLVEVKVKMPIST
jgi:hypothetical protein